MRASVVAARLRASALFWVLALVTLCDFVDDDGVPVVPAQVVDESVLLEGVHRDDDPPEEGERVAVGRQLLPDPLDAHRVEPDEGDVEARPHLVLGLLQHVARADDEDALAAAAADELGQDHADLDGLAQADGVGEQDARLEVGGVEGPGDGAELVVEGVGQAPVRDGQGRLADGDGRLAQGGLEPQPGAAVVRGVVGDRHRVARVEGADAVARAGGPGRVELEGLVEGGGGAAHERREALDGEELVAVVGLLDRRDEPLLVADHDG